ncbi:MAG TPA: biotin/lipoyl-containing protein [Candidatus Methylomirabilis sp.]|nr:biotin/lipoyl-containing protein [Candidatus Methylomirabilis sp.]
MKLKIGIDGKEYEVDIEILEDDTVAGGYFPPHGPATTVQPVSVPTPGLDVPPGGENVDESKVCRSPVAGVVVKLNVQPGQALQTNDLMLVLEAMKMETNITAPVAGKVNKVNVAHGDGVKVNQVLVEFE